MSDFNDGLTMQQGLALAIEQGSARQLLAHGVLLMRNATYVDPIQEPVLTTWSIGVEKVLKISHGLLAVSHGQPWPNLFKTYGHKLSEMDADLRSSLHAWMESAPRSEYIRGVMAAVDDDPIWPQLLLMLDTYGRSGRFHYLDLLAMAPPGRDAPAGEWSNTEILVVDHTPGLLAMRNAAIGGPSENFDEFLGAKNEAMAESLVRWWFMITRLAMLGALGARGVAFGADTQPGNAMPTVRPSL